MNHRQILLALWVLVALLVGCRAKPKPLTDSAFRLENGLEVELLPAARGEKAALVLLFRVGADHDPPGRSGMAHLLENLLLTSGVGGKPPRAREQLGQQYGSGWHTYTGAEYTLAAVEVPEQRILDEVDDVASRMSRLELKQIDLDRERPGVLARSAAMREGDPMLAAMNHAAEAIRPSRGGGFRGGLRAEIESITLAELEAHWRSHYGARNARLIVVGRFDPEVVRAHIEASFSKVPAAKAPVRRDPAESRVTGTLVMGDAPAAVALAVPVPEVKEPTYPAFVVLAARLAGPPAPARRWKCDFSPLERPDTLLVTQPINPGEPAEATAERVRKEVSAIVDAPLVPGEQTRALERFGRPLGATPLKPEDRVSTPYAVAFERGRRAELGIDGKALADAISSVTQEQLIGTAKLFDAQHSAAVIAGGKIR